MRNVLIASIAPASVVAVRGIIIAGGNGPVKGIRMAGVVIEDAPLYVEGVAWEKGEWMCSNDCVVGSLVGTAEEGIKDSRFVKRLYSLQHR